MSFKKLPLAAIVVAFACLLFSSSSAQAVRVNGISDNATHRWSPPSLWWSTGLNEVGYMRKIINWDVAFHPEQYQDMELWLTRAAQLRKRVVVSFGGLDEPAPLDYRYAIHSFRLLWPQVTEFTAWNEPNHVVSGHPRSDVPAATAAKYWKQLNEECQVPIADRTCAAIAGDFADNSELSTYTAAYKAELGSLRPAVWALHAYAAVNRDQLWRVDNFLADVWPAPVFITEVGAYFCQDFQLARSPAGTVAANVQQAAQFQRASARRIAALGAGRPQIMRIYYYQLAIGVPAAGSTGECRDKDDASLIDRYDVERPGLGVIKNGVPIPMLFKDGTWEQRYSFDTANDPNRVVQWGQPGDQPVFGDWDGDGVKTPGILRNGTWWLTDDPRALDGTRARVFAFGDPSGTAVAGDWNGDGIDTIGVRVGNTFYLRNSNTAGMHDITPFSFGDPSNKVVIGDWNGDRIDSVGVVVNDAWYVKNWHTTGVSDNGWFYGGIGDKPVVGDWDGDGVDDPGVYRSYGGSGTWFLGKQGQTGNLFGFFSYFADGSEAPLAG
ncbi:hypothetical protein VSS74_22735 [Conexibacter stalactiti]|uniref:Asl1-like glycosyl hydrolase catalytic domain-containing protein n=1 Tax=Conexibacter stalactiti TaxID=1940611 RepID=A0ABU4HV42_9ACTN|nr:hypothetical protein [Conexibacter stalactiti]MDW5597181.1 hypothetical protein [Conexibacter stalactiti]MEC5037823.1 hypothetical protein [Conexibacter stalactiti]